MERRSEMGWIKGLGDAVFRLARSGMRWLGSDALWTESATSGRDLLWSSWDFDNGRVAVMQCLAGETE